MSDPNTWSSAYSNYTTNDTEPTFNDTDNSVYDDICSGTYDDEVSLYEHL